MDGRGFRWMWFKAGEGLYLENGVCCSTHPFPICSPLGEVGCNGKALAPPCAHRAPPGKLLSLSQVVHLDPE